MKNLWGIIISVIMVSAISACGTKEIAEETVKEYTGVVTFTVGECNRNGTPLNVGDRVNEKDTITTGREALAVIQFSQDAVLTIKSDSEVSIEALSRAEGEDTRIGIAQKKGSTFNKIVRGGTDYKVTTQTAVAAVRGTSFEMIETGKGTKVNLLQGKVDMKPVRQGKVVETETVELDSGFSLEVTTEKIEAPIAITPEQQEKLEAFNAITVVPEVEKIAEKKEAAALEQQSAQPGTEIEKALEETPAPAVYIPEVVVMKIKLIEKEEVEAREAEEKEEEKAAPPKILTLKDIQAKYGQLSEIEMKNGTKHIGAFNQKGDKMEIITIKGNVTVSTQDVVKISRHRM